MLLRHAPSQQLLVPFMFTGVERQVGVKWLAQGHNLKPQASDHGSQATVSFLLVVSNPLQVSVGFGLVNSSTT